jgi:EAL domain-containing protein (putative c-di-GMP-specific phosphodiesterase class I)
LELKVSFAFQPIIDAGRRTITAYEAFMRGINQESAASLLRHVTPAGLIALDREARRKAVEHVTRLKLPVALHLNVTQGGLSDTAQSVRELHEFARESGLRPNLLVLEIAEHEILRDVREFARAVGALRAAGVRLAIDDFGAAWSALNLLADYQPDLIKLDMTLIRGIQGHGPRQAIVRAILGACDSLGIQVIAEGVEAEREYGWLRAQGISLFQGYLFAPPGFEVLPTARIPDGPIAGQDPAIRAASGPARRLRSAPL